MAKYKSGGLINRLIVGKEKSEEYARESLPSNRWELFWDIFKGRFWKLVLLNLLVLLFVITVFLLFLYREGVIIANGENYPFSQVFGVGYLAPTSLKASAESIIFNVDKSVLILFPVATIIACVGIAGASYVIRNMVWTEGIFVANDFWVGIKRNYVQIFFIGVLYSFIYYLSMTGVSYFNYLIAVGEGTIWLYNVAKYSLIIFLIFSSIVAIYMVNLSITYELKFRHLLKNGILFTIGLIGRNLLIAGLSALPFLLLSIGGILGLIILLLVVVIGFSYFMLMWINFCQWGFDENINSKIGAKKNRGIYEKVKKNSVEQQKKISQQKTINAINALYSKPIKPITDDELKIAELPQSFSRDDLKRLKESKDILYEDNRKYEEENGPTEEDIIQRDKEIKEREKRIEKAKRELQKHRRR